MSEVRVVLVTAPNVEVAGRLSRTLVEERLAACVNLVPDMTSIYRWEGRVHEDREVLLVMKTHASRLSDLLARVPELHPYDVPEILALDVEAGHEPYLAWVSTETR